MIKNWSEYMDDTIHFPRLIGDKAHSCFTNILVGICTIGKKNENQVTTTPN